MKDLGKSTKWVLACTARRGIWSMRAKAIETWLRARPNVCSRIRKHVTIVGLCLFASQAFAAQSSNPTGQVQGRAFVQEAVGQSYIAKAKVTLNGPAIMEAETDEAGQFEFREVQPGTYTIEAAVPGLAATQVLTVEVNKVLQISFELKPTAVHDSVTVTATASEALASSASPSGSITSSTLSNAPNIDDRAESILPIIPGVVRGPDGRINMKGARSTQSGALVNSANATDPATGNPGIAVPIDVVASVQVISNPYDPQYGKLTGAVSTIDTKTSDYEKFHFSIQNVMPRVRVRDGSIFGVGGATPRMMVTGPILNDRIAFTQSIEYRFIRTPVNSLPPFERDSTLESVNSYTQFDLNLTPTQTATVSFSLYPQKLKDMGLNTFMPQPSAPDYHQRGYQVYAQHRYMTGEESLLTSQFSYKVFDADITPHSDDLYQLQVETTEGGFFNSQARRSTRLDLDETYQFAPRHLWGQHQWKMGLDYAHSHYDGQQVFRPVEIDGASGTPIESISFTGPGSASIDQHEAAAFVMDQWTPFSRFSLEMGTRLDHDTVTDATHMAPRGSFQ